MIDLPTLVQDIRINTSDLSVAEARAAAFGARFDESGKKTEVRSKQIEANVDKLGTTGTRALGQVEQGMADVEHQAGSTSAAVSKLSAVGRESLAGLSAAQLDLRRANLQLADAQQQVSEKQDHLNSVMANGASTDRDLVRAQLDLVDAHRKVITATESVDRENIRSTKSTNEHTSALSRLTGEAGRFVKGFNPVSHLMGGLKIPVIAAGVQLLAGAVSALTGGAASLLDALAPTVGLFASMPALIIGVAASVGVFKLALSGVPAALKAINSGDITKTQEALQALPPAVLPLVSALSALQPRFAALKESVAQGLVPGLQRGLQAALPMLGTLRTGLTSLGTTLGNVGAKFGTLLGSASFRRDFSTTLTSANVAIGRAGTGAVAAARGFVSLSAAAAPLTEWLGSLARSLGEWINRTVEANRANGSLAAFLDRTRSTLTDLGHAVRDTGAALRNIFHIGGQETGANTLIGTLAEGAAKMRAWTESSKGILAIQKYFAQAQPALHQFGLLFRDIGKFIAQAAGNQDLPRFISLIRTKLLPAVEDLANGVTSRMGPALVEAGTAFLRFENLLSFSPLITVVELFARVTAAVLTFAAKVPVLGPVLGITIASFLALRSAIAGLAIVGKFTGLTALASSLRTIGPAGSAGAKGMAGFIQGMRGAAVIGSVSNGIGLASKEMLVSAGVAVKGAAAWAVHAAAATADTVAVAAQSLALKASAAAMAVMTAVTESSTVAWIASAAASAVETVALGVQSVAMYALAVAEGVATEAMIALDAAMDANPIGLIILAVAGLVIGLIELVKHFRGAETGVRAVGHAIEAFGGWVVTAAKWVAHFVASIGDLHSRLGRIATIVGLANPFTALGTALLVVARNWGAVKAAFGDVGGLFTRAYDAVQGFVGRMFSAGEDIVVGIINGIKSKAGDLAHEVLNLGKEAVEAPFKAVLGIFSPSRVMAEAGAEIPRGIALGINSHANDVTVAMQGIANGLRSTARSTAADVNNLWRQIGAPRAPVSTSASAGTPTPAAHPQTAPTSLWDSVTDVGSNVLSAIATGAARIGTALRTQMREQARQNRAQSRIEAAQQMDGYYQSLLSAAKKARTPVELQKALDQQMQSIQIFSPATQAPLTRTSTPAVSQSELNAVAARVARLQSAYDNAVTDVQRLSYDKQLQAAQAQQTKLQALQGQTIAGSDPIGALRQKLQQSASNATQLAAAVHTFVQDGVSKPVLDQLLQLEQQAPGTLHAVVQSGMVEPLIREATHSYKVVHDATKHQLADAAIAGVNSARDDAAKAAKHLATVLRENYIADIKHHATTTQESVWSLLLGPLAGGGGPGAGVIVPKSFSDLLTPPLTDGATKAGRKGGAAVTSSMGSSVRDTSPAAVAGLGGLLTPPLENIGHRSGTKGGHAIGDGLAGGMAAKHATVVTAATHLAQQAWNAIADLLGIHSPSQVGHDLGSALAEGFANGISAHHALATRAAASLAAGAAGALSAPLPTVHSPAQAAAQAASARRQGATGATAGTEKIYAPVFRFGDIHAADMGDVLDKASRAASHAAIIGLDPAVASGIMKAIPA